MGRLSNHLINLLSSPAATSPLKGDSPWQHPAAQPQLVRGFLPDWVWACSVLSSLYLPVIVQQWSYQPVDRGCGFWKGFTSAWSPASEPYGGGWVSGMWKRGAGFLFLSLDLVGSGSPQCWGWATQGPCSGQDVGGKKAIFL